MEGSDEERVSVSQKDLTKTVASVSQKDLTKKEFSISQKDLTKELFSVSQKDLTCLRQELDMQDMMARRAPKMHGDLSHQERALIQEQVELYLDGRLEKLPVVSVKQIEVGISVYPHIQHNQFTFNEAAW